MKSLSLYPFLAAVWLAAVPAAAQESAAFVVTLGRDTVAVERFTRTADRIEGVMINRTPRTSVRTWSGQLRPDGSISHLEVNVRVMNDPSVQQALTIDTSPDSAHWRLASGANVAQGGFSPGMASFPWMFNNFSLVEVVTRWARSAGRDTVYATVVQPGAILDSIRIIRLGADSVLLYSLPGLMRIRTDPQGRVLGVQSPESTLKVDVERLPSLDVMALADRFAAVERQGRGLGTLSPRDSVAARVGDADVAVVYGRPAMRGRRIMGQVVPWGQVWRTGGDAATHFHTSRDLQVAGTRVPAGSYSLWSVPGPDGWTLIINSQTGQWGTEYDQARDFARIPVRTERAPDGPVEAVTMRFLESECGEGATLAIDWENTRVVVPFTVVP